MGKPDEPNKPERALSRERRTDIRDIQPGTRDLTGIDHFKVSLNMNEAASAAIQVVAQEQTKQAEEETKQASERTKRTRWETSKMAMAALAIPAMVIAPAIMWPVALVGVALAAPMAVNSFLDRLRDLHAEKRKTASSLLRPLLGASSESPESSTDRKDSPR